MSLLAHRVFLLRCLDSVDPLSLAPYQELPLFVSELRHLKAEMGLVGLN
jgi:hypothetical protein